LLKGLEVNEVSFLKVLDNKDLRIEGEFHVTKGLSLNAFEFGSSIIAQEQYNSTYGLNSFGKG
jgi:hypothetical protein